MAPGEFPTYDATTVRQKVAEILDGVEYQQRHAIITRRGVPVIEAVPNAEYERYCTVSDFDPANMTRVASPRRGSPNDTIPHIDWGSVTASTIEMDATYVRNEMREIMSRISLSHMHVRVIRHNHSAAVFVPPAWAEEMRTALAPVAPPPSSSGAAPS